MIDSVIFDCDGTLLDSMPAWHALQERFAQRAGIAPFKSPTHSPRSRRGFVPARRGYPHLTYPYLTYPVYPY